MADPRHWVLVAGASRGLTSAHTRAAEAVGRMLGRSGCGLIAGRWPGTDHLVTRAFAQAVGPSAEQWLAQIDTTGGNPMAPRPPWFPGARRLAPEDLEGGSEYSAAAVELASAGLILPGVGGSLQGMEALEARGKPVLPLASLGGDPFDLLQSMLRRWSSHPLAERLTRQQLLELVVPSADFAPVERLLFAALQDEPVVFVSYRHADVPHAAARIAEVLAHRYGRRAVFIDVEGLRPGAHLGRRIADTVKGARAMVPVIGPRWEGVLDARGQRPIDRATDWIRMELEAAHAHSVSVLPVLVERSRDAWRPPEPLSWLEPLLSVEVDHVDLEQRLSRLVASLDSLVLPRRG